MTYYGLILNVKGLRGCFRMPETSPNMLSYSVMPISQVKGMLGRIWQIDIKDLDGWSEDFLIGLKKNRSIHTSSVSLNFINKKTSHTPIIQQIINNIDYDIYLFSKKELRYPDSKHPMPYLGQSDFDSKVKMKENMGLVNLKDYFYESKEEFTTQCLLSFDKIKASPQNGYCLEKIPTKGNWSSGNQDYKEVFFSFFKEGVYIDKAEKIYKINNSFMHLF